MVNIIGAVVVFGVALYCLWFFFRVVIAVGQDGWAAVKRWKNRRHTS